MLMPPQSGSQAGTTASRNRFGQYLRTRGIPVQPRTPKQTSNRAAFTNASSAWRAQSVADQDAWNVYASQIQRTDSLGQSYTPTGAELFVSAVIAFSDYGFNGPPPSVLPSYVLQVTEITYTDPTPGPEALTAAIAVTSPNNQFIIETSGPVSPGITSAAAVRRWFSLPQDAGNLIREFFAMTATPVAFLTEYKLLFPSPTPGQNIWFRFSEIFLDGTSLAGVVNRQKQTLRFVVP